MNNLTNADHRADDPDWPSRKEYLQIRQRTTNSRRPVRPVWHVDIVSISSDDMRDEARGYKTPFSQKLSGKRQNNVSYASVAGSNKKRANFRHLFQGLRRIRKMQNLIR